jgi:hypothetical protein
MAPSDTHGAMRLSFLMFGCALAGCSTEPSFLVASDEHAIFDTVADRPLSQPTVFTFYNIGDRETAPLSVRLSGDATYQLTADGCSFVQLGGHKSCEVAVTLGSEEAGSFDAELRVSDGRLVHAEVLLSGKVAPAELAFHTQLSPIHGVYQGDQPEPLVMLVHNVGGATSGPVHITSEALPFSISGDCEGRALAGGDECTLTLAHPRVPLDAPVGPLSGTLIATAIPGGEARATPALEVEQSGALQVAATSWGDVAEYFSDPRDVVITNPGPQTAVGIEVELTIDPSSPVQGGPGFKLVNNLCATPLQPLSSCRVTVLLQPWEEGLYLGSLKAWAANAHPGSGSLSAISKHRSWNLKVHFAVTGLGSIGIYDGTERWTEDVTFTVPNGQYMPLKAYPAPGNVFLGWSGAGCSGVGGCNAVGPDNGSAEVTVTFGPMH